MNRILISLCLAALALPAVAQTPDWTVTVGSTVISSPDFPGSEERRVLAVPYWDIEYKRRFYSKGLDFAGVYLLNGPAWKGGAALNWEFDGRDEDDRASFAGLGDVDNTLRAKLFTSYTRSLLTISADASHDVLGNGHGLTGSASATVAVPFFSPWFFAAGPGVSWIDEENAMTFFGVDPEQSARSGIGEFRAGAGLRDVRFTAIVSRKLNQFWSASTVVSVRNLRGGAAASPLTDTNRATVFIVTLSRRVR